MPDLGFRPMMPPITIDPRVVPALGAGAALIGGGVAMAGQAANIVNNLNATGGIQATVGVAAATVAVAGLGGVLTVAGIGLFSYGVYLWWNSDTTPQRPPEPAQYSLENIEYYETFDYLGW